MKVLYVYDAMPETYQAYLWHPLRALRKDLSVKTLAYHAHPEADHVVVHGSWASKMHRLAGKLGLAKSDRMDLKIMQQFDIIHLQHSYLFPKLKPLMHLPANRRPKIVITLRGGDTYVKPWISAKWREFYKVCQYGIDKFVVMSEHQKNYLTRWGVNDNQIDIIPISFGNLKNSNSKKPNRGIMKIISIFRMCWEKNIDGNLKVIMRLKELGIPIQYDVYGGGSDLGQLYYLVDKYKLTSEVNILGKKNNMEIQMALSDYDFLLQLSHSESLGMSVIEAQSMGVPVIVSMSDGLPEAMKDQVTGYILDMNELNNGIDKIKDLWIDVPNYQKYSQQAIQFVNEKFTSEIEITRLKKLYTLLLKQALV